jgi:integrase
VAPKPETLSCPQCGSTRLYRDGLRYLADGNAMQRWLCRECGYRFTEPRQNRSEALKRLPRIDRQFLKSDFAILNKRQVCDCLTEASKNLTIVENPAESGLAGATETLRSTPSAKILEYAWWLKKEGYAESTIVGRVKLLRRLVKLGADLYDPESIKEVIAKQESWSLGRKELAVEAYSSFLIMTGGKWNPPKYHRIEKLPFIPTEEELDQLIAGCGPKTSTFLQLLKETGMRAGEAWKLKWTDIDFTNATVRVTPEKGSKPRIPKISSKLISMLNSLKEWSWGQDTPQKRKPDYIFGGYPIRGFARGFQRKRKELAKRYGNPRLPQISFHTFRHWKATTEYHKTKDILHVMRLLGHKNIKNTLIYTQLVDFEEKDEFICKVATTNEEISQLIEMSFEYVCEHNGAKFFRKRK